MYFPMLTSIFSCITLLIEVYLCDSISSYHFTPLVEYRGKKANNPLVSKICKSRLDCLTFCSKTGVAVAVMYDPAPSLCYCCNNPVSRMTLSDAQGFEVYHNMENDFHRSWVSRIQDVSSHFVRGDKTYSANNMLGACDFYPKYGNSDHAWCPRYKDSAQYIELGFDEAIYIRKIYIYETYFAGGVKTVSILNPNRVWVKVWTTKRLKVIRRRRKFVPPIQPLKFRSDVVRLDLGLDVTNEWSEFDAVEVTGYRTNRRARKRLQ